MMVTARLYQRVTSWPMPMATSSTSLRFSILSIVIRRWFSSSPVLFWLWVASSTGAPSEITIKMRRCSGRDIKRRKAHSSASPSIFSLSRPSRIIRPRLRLARRHGISAPLYMMWRKSFSRPGAMGFPAAIQSWKDFPPFQARVVKPRISAFTPQRSSVRAIISAVTAATMMGRPRIEPELSIRIVTMVSRKSVSFSSLKVSADIGSIITRVSRAVSSIPSSRSKVQLRCCCASNLRCKRLASREIAPDNPAIWPSKYPRRRSSSSVSQRSSALSTSSLAVV